MTPAHRRLAASLLVLTGLFANGSLFAGARYLTWPVGPFPLGNLLTVVGLVALPAAAGLFTERDSWLRRLCVLAVIVGLLWYPISIVLAGNVFLNFSNDSGQTWLGLTVATSVLALLAPLLVVIARLVALFRSS
ncbi:MAG: hypothetical protein AAF660_07180 [Pseudomonadota bacterium]